MVRQKNKTHTVTYSGPCALQWYDNKNKNTYYDLPRAPARCKDDNDENTHTVTYPGLQREWTVGTGTSRCSRCCRNQWHSLDRLRWCYRQCVNTCSPCKRRARVLSVCVCACVLAVIETDSIFTIIC